MSILLKENQFTVISDFFKNSPITTSYVISFNYLLIDKISSRKCFAIIVESSEIINFLNSFHSYLYQNRSFVYYDKLLNYQNVSFKSDETLVFPELITHFDL